ncbi:hypothetical protein AVEN_61983-1 [Araneus ventricosus]|uniref:Uncharacterized protein n=1 Tax=Araneus ventricosus TaxID=182803 RepID=A0A4Y2J8H9_ARAVE|nr:hypothetical protein AVEN_61983-1 [Araneus ventricosus]
MGAIQEQTGGNVAWPTGVFGKYSNPPIFLSAVIMRAVCRVIRIASDNARQTLSDQTSVMRKGLSTQEFHFNGVHVWVNAFSEMWCFNYRVSV